MLLTACPVIFTATFHCFSHSQSVFKIRVLLPHVDLTIFKNMEQHACIKLCKKVWTDCDYNSQLIRTAFADVTMSKARVSVCFTVMIQN